MYYDPRPERRMNEQITRVYINLRDWVDANGTEGIRDHLTELIDAHYRRVEEERERHKQQDGERRTDENDN